MPDFDAVVVGARCAGSTAAMVLATAGARVLLLDRAPFPSDTISTHFIWHRGVRQLTRWGLLGAVQATGAPAIHEITTENEYARLSGPLPPVAGSPAAYAPRRNRLDPVLAQAAVSAGAEFRDRCRVTGLLWDSDRVAGVRYATAGGVENRVTAHLVVGADGQRSSVARLVNARSYAERPTLTCAYYSYWSGLASALELHVRHRRMAGAIPTNDGLTLVATYLPREEFGRVRRDATASYLDTVAHVAPDLFDRLRSARQEERLVGVGEQPNFFRQASGPGWVLVGDAGHSKDSVPAFGISDAFEQSSLLGEVLTAPLQDHRSVDTALATFATRRDAMLTPGYGLALRAAALAPDATSVHLMRSVAGDAELTQQYFGLMTGAFTYDDVVARIEEHCPAGSSTR